MRYKTNLLHLSLVMCAVYGTARESLCNSSIDTKDHICFYVSVEGNDVWSGARATANDEQTDGPFATVERARDAIRHLRAQGEVTRPVAVMVLDGTYFLDKPIELTGVDSGTPEYPVTFMAFPGHHPIFSGGRRIADWTPYDREIIQSALDQVRDGQWMFRQLFCNGEAQVRARWPNRKPSDPIYSGWNFIEHLDAPTGADTVQFFFTSESQPRHWSKPSQAEVNVFPGDCWVNDIVPVARIDPSKRTIALGRAPQHSLVAGNRFIVENVLEELDQPGEWCLDRESGVVYFWPPSAIADTDVIAPRLDTLIRLTGTSDQPVRHVTMSGLTFSHTNSPFPEQQHVIFHSPTLVGAAVRLEYCEDCSVSDCHFHELGGDAVRLHGSNEHNRISGNEIGYVGGAGVSLVSHASANTDTWADRQVLRQISLKYPKLIRNEITNNHIHHCGVIKKNCGGVQFYGINSVDNLVAHNAIHDMPDKGIAMQDGFGRSIIEYNDIRMIGLEIADTGAIMTNRWFTLDEDPELADGIVIRFNRIRDCVGCGAYTEQRVPKGEGDRIKGGGRIWSPYFCWGIYFDNSAINTTVFGNVVEATVLGAVSMPTGSAKNNRVENNIFVNSSGNQLDLRMGTAACNNRFVRNIIYYTNQDAMLLAAQPEAREFIIECDHNLYFPARGQPSQVRGIGSFTEWQSLGFDQHSLLVDPLFVDAAAGDYHLRDESPAWSLGFQYIDLKKIGLCEPYRTRLTDKKVNDAVSAGR